MYFKYHFLYKYIYIKAMGLDIALWKHRKNNITWDYLCDWISEPCTQTLWEATCSRTSCGFCHSILKGCNHIITEA